MNKTKKEDKLTEGSLEVLIWEFKKKKVVELIDEKIEYETRLRDKWLRTYECQKDREGDTVHLRGLYDNYAGCAERALALDQIKHYILDLK